MKFQRRNGRAAKLTAGQVVEIRNRYATGTCSQGDLAREFDMSVVQIGRIVRNEVWRQLPPSLMSPEEIEMSARRVMEIQIAMKREQEQAGDRMAAELAGVPKSPLDE